MNATSDQGREMRQVIDLNADMGEGFGRYALDDGALLGSVTSASVACGFHAGDPVVMRDTVTRAVSHGVTIGALQAVCTAAGARLRYVKPHGALYNRAALDVATANAIVRAVRAVDPSLALLCLAGSAMLEAAERGGIRGVSEGFVDRAYRRDGSLVPRSEPGAILTDVDAVAERALRMVRTGTLDAIDGGVVSVHVESLCTHGDGADAVAIVRAIRARLESAGVVVAPFARD